MKNNKAMALPIVMVFMFLSHLTYISLLHYNQIQSMRYQDIMHYYQAQSMLTMSNNLLTETNTEQQLIQRLTEVINHQMSYLVPGNAVMIEEEKSGPQVTMLQIEYNNSQQILIISHQIYIEEAAVQNLALSELIGELKVEGVVLSNKLPRMFEDAPIQNQVQELLIQFNDLGWEQNFQSQRNYQGQLTIQPPPYTQFDFNIGKVVVKNTTDGRQTKVYDLSDHLLYQEQHLFNKIGFLVISQVITLEERIDTTLP